MTHAQIKTPKKEPKSKASMLKKIDTFFIKAKEAISKHDVKNAEQYLDICLKIATENNLDAQKITCQYYYGNLYLDLKEYKQAISYFSTGLSLSINSRDYENQVNFNEKLAYSSFKSGDYDLAQQYYERLIELYTEKNNLHGVANTYSSLGSMWFAKKEMEKAQEYLAKASAIFNDIKNDKSLKPRDLSPDKINTEKEFEEGEEFEEKQTAKTSKNEKSSLTNSSAASSLLKIGNVYKEMGNFKQAEIHFKKSYEIYKDEKKYVEMTAAIISLGDISLNNKDIKSAKKYYLKSLDIATKKDLKISQMESYKGLSYILSIQKDYKGAYDYYQKYIAERDLIYAEERMNEIQKIQSKMDLEKQDIQINLLTKEQEVAKITRERDQVWFYALVLGLFVLIGVLFLLYNRYRLKKELTEVLSSKNNDMQKIIVELKESEKQLVELNSTKDQFFSIISHDLKGPINSLKGYLSLVKAFPDNFSANDLRDFAVRMDGSVKNLSQLLNNLLEWAMVQTGAIKTRIEKFDVNEVINHKVELYTPQIAAKSITLNFFKNRDVFAMADKNMIEFVIRNLLHNAIKFTKSEGTIDIEVTVKDGFVNIKISDSGIGMDEQALQSLFNANRRYIQEGTNNERGSGLGLILCKDFVTRNNGKILVESMPNKGSKFTVQLPSA
jgi:signal transduction histidine kinase